MSHIPSRSSHHRSTRRGGLLAGFLGVVLAAGTAAPLQAETILKFAPTVPLENATATRVWQPWVDKVNAEAKGEFRIQLFGLALANPRNVWERTLSGVVDIGFALHGTVGVAFPKTSVSTLPLLVEDGEAGAASVALWELYRSGLIADEYKDLKVLGLIALPVQGIASQASIGDLDDLKGKKMRVADKLSADIAEALGASPISLSATEVYQALSRGVVDSAVANWIMMGAFRLTEVSKQYLTGIPLGAPTAFVVMNPSSFAKLSEKGKKILEKHVGASLSREAGNGLEGLAHGASAKFTAGDSKYRIVKLDANQKERWRKALQSVQDRWVSNTPDGQKILEQFKVELEAAKK